MIGYFIYIVLIYPILKLIFKSKPSTKVRKSKKKLAKKKSNSIGIKGLNIGKSMWLNEIH